MEFVSQFLKGNNIAVELFYIKKQNNKNMPYISNKISKSNVLDKEIIDMVSNYSNKLPNIFQEYDINIGEDGYIETISSESVPKLLEINKAMEDGNYLENIEKNQVDKFDFYCIKFTDEEEKVLQVFSSYKKCKSFRKNMLGRLVNNTFTKIENDYIVINESFDAVEYEGRIYISNRFKFITIFNYYDVIYKNAESKIDGIEKLGCIENFDDFKNDIVENKKFIKKISEIAIETITDIDELEKMINLRDDIDVTIKNKKIIYNDKTEVLQILDLLSDKYATTDWKQEKTIMKGSRKK